MKTEEIKVRYEAFPARVKDENAKITAFAKGLTALNKTHASICTHFITLFFRQREGDLGLDDFDKLHRCHQGVVAELPLVLSGDRRFSVVDSRGIKRENAANQGNRIKSRAIYPQQLAGADEGSERDRSAKHHRQEGPHARLRAAQIA